MEVDNCMIYYISIKVRKININFSFPVYHFKLLKKKVRI